MSRRPTRLRSSLAVLAHGVGGVCVRGVQIGLALVAMFVLLTGLDMAGELRADVTASAQSAPTSLVPQPGYVINGNCRDLAEGFATGNFELFDIPCYVTYLTEMLIYFAGVIAVLFIVIGGYQYIIGSISDDKESGKKTITYALGGLAVTIVAWTVVNAWQVFVTSGDYKVERAAPAPAPTAPVVVPTVPPTVPTGPIKLTCPGGGEADGVMAYVASNEGFKNDKYLDNLGKPTIGVGHLIVAGENFTHLDDAGVKSLYATDYTKHAQQATVVLPNFASLDPARQAVIIDLTFNMGSGWASKFKKFTAAMKTNDFEAAYKELALNGAGTGPSPYITQVGARARNNADIIKTGDANIILKKASADKRAVAMMCSK